MNRLVFFYSLFNYCYVVLFLLIRRNALLFTYLLAFFFICLRIINSIYVVRCAIWYHLYNLKNVKNTHGGVFFTFFKLYKRYQISQRTKYKEILLTLTENFSKTTLRKLLIFCQRTFLIKIFVKTDKEGLKFEPQFLVGDQGTLMKTYV